MENEEIRALIDKKDYDDQLVAFVNVEFCQLQFGPLYSTLSHNLGHLEFSWSILGGVWHTWDFGVSRKGARGHQDQQLHRIFIVDTELHV